MATSRSEADLDDDRDSLGDTLGAYLQRIGSIRLLTAAEEVQLAFDIEAGVLAAERLTNAAGDQRAELRYLVDQGERARIRMIESNLRLVVSIAKRLSPAGSLMDLVQDGTVGLIHAVRKFDYRRGCKFSTYATWWIRQAISRGLASTTRTVRLPAHVSSRLQSCLAERRTLTVAWGREPTAGEIAERCGGSPEEITTLLRHAAEPVSLEAAAGFGGVVDQIHDRAVPDPSELAAGALSGAWVRDALAALTRLEREVVSRRYGLDGPAYGSTAVSKQLGLSRERVRHIEHVALGKLRTIPTIVALRDDAADPTATLPRLAS